MDKKDIYEHLAKIYLDASSKKKGKPKIHRNFRNPFFVGVTLLTVLAVVLFFNFKRNNPGGPEIALVLLSDAAKINFHFDPAKKETLSLNLNGLNLNSYRALAFTAKTANPKNQIRLRVELTNGFREKSEVYLDYLPGKWKEFRINLNAFKSISEWSEMYMLSFVTEEWNVKEKKGIAYIDNVRFLK